MSIHGKKSKLFNFGMLLPLEKSTFTHFGPILRISYGSKFMSNLNLLAEIFTQLPALFLTSSLRMRGAENPWAVLSG